MNHTIQCRVFGFNQIQSGNVQFLKCPYILERSTGSLTANGGSVAYIGIEGGIKVDKINTSRVHPPHNIEIISGP